MRTVSSNNTTVLPLGKQGENLAEKIIFTDPISWLKGYGTGTAQLLNQRPGEDTPYPVVISEESDGSYSWAVTAADTALAGQGKCELRYLSGDTVVKSRIWSTIVNDALGEPSDTPPESQQGWVDKVLQAGTDAQEAAKRAEDAAVRQPYPNEETGTWWVWDAEAGAYKDTGISCGGSGGSSVELDATLTKAGKAADAAAVGARLSTLSEDITSQVATHNTGTDTHSDIRLLISGLTDRLNALADSDDTTLDQLSEVVAYIKANRDLISSITTDKVSVADVIDNLTTNVANKPLSAAQGVALKALIDAISVPDKLPNPNALTFTGAVTGSYDGSEPVSVEIPSGGGAWHTIGTQEMDGVETAVSFDANGETIVQIVVAGTAESLNAKKATVSFTHQSGGTFDFYQQPLNSAQFSPKNVFLIVGETKCRQMIFVKGESGAYSGTASFALEKGFAGAAQVAEKDPITKITITFDVAPVSGAVVRMEGM